MWYCYTSTWIIRIWIQGIYLALALSITNRWQHWGIGQVSVFRSGHQMSPFIFGGFWHDRCLWSFLYRDRGSDLLSTICLAFVCYNIIVAQHAVNLSWCEAIPNKGPVPLKKKIINLIHRYILLAHLYSKTKRERTEERKKKERKKEITK